MIKKILLLLLVTGFLSIDGYTQKIIYGTYHKEDDANIRFEIIGKIGQNYLVYKNLRNWKHVVQVFDDNMREIENRKLDYISSKTNNIDFIAYSDFVYVVYQYQKNSIVYCDMVALDSEGKKLADPITIDTTRIGYVNNNNIYFTRFSEDKSKILIYKAIEKNQKLTLVTRLYNSKFELLDSTRRVESYNERRELYTDLQVSNNGTIIYAKETKSGNRENIRDVQVFTQKIGEPLVIRTLPLEKNYIDELKIKIDNLNNTYIFNAFYYTDKFGNIAGLLSANWDLQNATMKMDFNEFPDTLRTMINTNDFRFAFNDFFLKDIFVKRDGGFIIVAEDYTYNRRSSVSPWNRWDYLYNNMYRPGDYYYGNSSNYPYYRYRNTRTSISYAYNDVLILGIDKNLKTEWSNLILKNQTDDDRDIFLSYTTLNRGNEINFLFIDKEKNTQIISNHSITAEGKLVRYPTIKSRENGFDFMPRLAKQVGAREIIMPSIYRGYIVFTKIEF